MFFGLVFDVFRYLVFEIRHFIPLPKIRYTYRMGEEQPSQQKPADELKRIQTFQSDVEEMMRRQKVSKATIAISEDKRKARVEEPDSQDSASPSSPDAKVFKISSGLPLPARRGFRFIALIVAGILVLGGIGAGAFFVFKRDGQTNTSLPETEVKQSIAIALESRENREGVIKAIWSRVRDLSVPQNELRVIPITLDATPITTAKLLEKIEASAPAPLVRALGQTPTLGVHGFRGGKPFLIWSVSSYDHAFDGMLSWEKNMLRDIGPLFGISVRDIVEKAASTTSEVLGNTIAIKDIIIRNKDVRAAYDPKGEIIFLYSFIDKETLVLSTNEDTLRFLLGKAGGGRLR